MTAIINIFNTLPLDSHVCGRCKEPFIEGSQLGALKLARCAIQVVRFFTSQLARCSTCVDTVYHNQLCKDLHINSHFSRNQQGDPSECENVFSHRKLTKLREFKTELNSLCNEHWLQNILFAFYDSEGTWVAQSAKFHDTDQVVQNESAMDKYVIFEAVRRFHGPYEWTV